MRHLEHEGKATTGLSDRPSESASQMSNRKCPLVAAFCHPALYRELDRKQRVGAGWGYGTKEGDELINRKGDTVGEGFHY